MIKITITIEEVSQNEIKKNNTIKGKYIITRSNFGGAYILGVPCKIVSGPFMGTDESYTGKERKCMCIEVVSCITGIQYTIPYEMDWINIYDTFASVHRACKSLWNHYYICPNPETISDLMTQIEGKKYYPMDNSYSELLSDKGSPWVAGEEVEILGAPYTDTTPYGKTQFVTVRKNNGSIVKCMFMEWKLLP